MNIHLGIHDFPSETPFLAPTPLRYVREIQRASCTVCQVRMKIKRAIEICFSNSSSFQSFQSISDHVYSNFHSTSAIDTAIKRERERQRACEKYRATSKCNKMKIESRGFCEIKFSNSRNFQSNSNFSKKFSFNSNCCIYSCFYQIFRLPNAK